MIKAVIFDMDGVLVDSMKFHVESWRFAFNKFGINPSKRDLFLLEGLTYRETIDVLSKKYSVVLSSSQKQEIHLIKKKRLEEIFDHNIYPLTLPLLHLLKKYGLRLALVTGANKEFTTEIIGMFFEGFFDVVVTGDDVVKGKPDPESYLTAVKKLNIANENLLVVENAPLGIRSAKSAGLKTFALTTTLDSSFLSDADKIFNSHEELISFFEDYFN